MIQEQVMAKKTSRKVSKGSTAASPEAVTGTTTGARASFSSRVNEPVAAPTYPYVSKDLKRIGTLAGIMFGGMIVLYFILPYILPLYAR
jgi:hypothetical protein